MELFRQAKTIRLRSHHDKYLLAEDDEETVCQDRNGTCKNAKWTVEILEGSTNILRFKSCFGKYLRASNMPFLLKMSGKKVLQTVPRRLDSSIEWEPISEGFRVRLKTRYGNYLRANGGVPPWRNSITHDIPHRTTTQEWISWEVVIEIRTSQVSRPLMLTQPVPKPEQIQKPDYVPQLVVTKPRSSQANQVGSPRLSKLESSDSVGDSPVKSDGRTIYYSVGEDEKADANEDTESHSFTFKGNGVEELKQKLEEETGLTNIVVCSRSPLNGNIYPLRLHLPPNTTTMNVVVLPSSSKDSEDVD